MNIVVKYNHEKLRWEGYFSDNQQGVMVIAATREKTQELAEKLVDCLEENDE